MKKIILSICVLFNLNNTNAQVISNFENLNLPLNSFWNGSETYGHNSFTSGNAKFNNHTTKEFWGDFWQSGWAYSNVIDSTTAGSINAYAVRAGIGADNSANYVIGKDKSKIILTGESKGKTVDGFYVCNSTYAALSMENGDKFGKKFGGDNGTDADWFKLSVKKYLNGELSSNEIEFYLADFRFENSNEDYIVTNWTWLDLTNLGDADSLLFTLSSSDNNDWGMNTPAFFALDNLKTFGTPTSNNFFVDKNLKVYPNPFNNHFSINSIEGKYQVRVINISGQIIHDQNYESNSTIVTNNWNSGIYFVNIIQNNQISTTKLIKQ